LNGTVAPPTRCRQSTAVNPYETRKKVPTPFALNEAMNSRPSAKPTTNPSTTALSSSQINEDSPTIKRILAASGCASVEELLVRDQQKAQANNGNGSKSTRNRNGSKTDATNRSKTATNGAPNVAKTATKGAKATNPKKKSKSKYFYL